MLYFRERESEKLRRFICSNQKAMALYARRRVGKTELILDYISHNPSDGILYFQCGSYDYRVCLEDFASVLKPVIGHDSILDSLKSFRDMISYVSEISSDVKCVVIDEFPFLCKKQESAVVEFQWIIDHGLGNLKLILLGSNISFMENQLNDREAPLYGRFDEILEILPFSFPEVKQLFENFEDAVTVYSMTGGVAQYVMLFTEYDSVSLAAAELFFNKNGRLFHEAANLLMQELREVASYSSILRSIAGGEKTSGQIAGKCGMDPRGIYTYLNKLIDLHIVTMVENPLSTRKTDKRYRIRDGLFRFSFTFIEPNLSMITALGAQSIKFILDNKFREYLGSLYEDIVRESLFSLAAEAALPFMPQNTGKWWGNIPQDDVWGETEVDVIAYNDTDILLGECKYKNKVVGLKEYELLRLKAQFIQTKGRKTHFLLAAKNGFTDELKALSDVILLEGISPIPSI